MQAAILPILYRVVLCLMLCTAVLSAATVSFTGSFSRDDDARFFTFDLTAPSTVTLLTYSYGGGTNAAGTTIPRGGFEPIISLFAGTGEFLASSGPDGNCPPQSADSVNGLCVDAYLQQPDLAAGSYLVALTQFFNVPNTPDVAAGFLQQGTGNFTGDTCGVAGGSFLDETCNQRTANFALDIAGVSSASEAADPTVIPEPATALLLLPPLALFALRRRLSARRS